MHTELADFADQVARFTWQYRRLDVLGKVTELLCPSYLPTSPTVLLEVVKAVRHYCPFKHSCTAPWILHKLITEVPLATASQQAYRELRHDCCVLICAWRCLVPCNLLTQRWSPSELQIVARTRTLDYLVCKG